VITIPIASFLAGSLLTILLPLGVLIALTVWYVGFLRRVPDPGLRSPADAATPAAAAAPPEPPPT
jgi:hypothetical protein